MRSVDQLPAAIDMDRVEQGGRCLRRIGAITINGFGMAAGFYLGAILPGSASALAASTRTVQHPARRLSETARFVLTWSWHPHNQQLRRHPRGHLRPTAARYFLSLRQRHKHWVPAR
jgi:hypothetical protein